MADRQAANGELSLIGSGTVVEGKIRTEGSIRIDGRLVGDLTAKANAAVGAAGSVEGSLTARNVSLSGRVTGSITAGEKLILEGKSVMKGDIRASRLVVDEGATFDGQCTMTGGPAPGRAAAPHP